LRHIRANLWLLSLINISIFLQNWSEDVTKRIEKLREIKRRTLSG
jgi:hypothetical protein